MTKKEMVHLLKTDPKGWNAWREAHPTIYPNLAGVDLSELDLVGIDLGESNLDSANLSRTDLTQANFSKANLTEADLNRAIAKSANLREASLMGADLERCDLSLADLSRVSIENADLSDANLRGVDLSEANAMAADFTLADLHQANLTGAQLAGAVFAYCVLLEANLAGVHLSNTTFADADLEGVDLEHASLDGTRFINVDLSGVRGLDTLDHSGPSYVDIASIYRSAGNIPESFLRDTGVPEPFITQMRSLVDAQEGIQFYSCFISYSHKDEEFAHRLFSRLRDAKLRVWYAPEDMQGGQKLHEQIETAIRLHDKLLLVLSDASLQSEWVKTEIRNARRQERKTGKRKLFPVRLVDFETIREWECFDADGGKDLGVELREFYIPDFSHWKDHDRFEAEFKKLLRDLKAEGNPAA